MKCKIYLNILIIIVISNKYSESTTIKTIWSKTGQPITIPCDLSKPLNENYKLEWKKNFQTIFTANGNENGHSIAAYQGRLARATDLSLTFHNVNRQDSATYQCGITKDEELSQFGTLVKLIVYSAPDILVPLKDQTFFVQDSFEINCEAKGQPKPHIIWTKENQIISLNSTLKITNFKSSNNGQYFCHATNAEGTTNQSIIVLKGENPIMIKNLENITITENNNIHWQCETKSFPNNVSYSWFKNGKEISTNHFDSRFHFYKNEFHFDFVQKNDSGWYTCKADNGFKPNAESSAFLNVLYRPKVIVEPRVNEEYILPFDGNLTLICKIEGNPQIYSYQWTKDGHYLTTTFTNVLFLQNGSSTNAGIYTCQGFNLVGGGDVLEFVVTISEPLKFLKKPPPFIYVNVGENVKIECDGYGYPPPVQYWLRNKTRLSSHILEIQNISSIDGGIYQCILANGDNIAYQNVNLLVKNTVPQCPLNFQIGCFGDTGLNISFNSGFDGGYPQTFQIRSKIRAKHLIQNSKWIVDYPKNNVNFHLIDHKTPFSKIEIWLDAENIKGSTECYFGVHDVCSRLSPPKSLKLNGRNELIWEQVENAEEYLVAAKIGKNEEFIQLAKTKDIKYALHHSINASNPDLVIAVKALHEFYQDSDYSVLGKEQENEGFSKIFVIVSCFLMAIGGFLAYKHNFYNKKTNNEEPVLNAETKMLENDYMSDFQRMASTNTPFSTSTETNTTVERQFRHLTPDTERMSIVTDLFRKHYMDNPEYNKVNIIDELRLAQLKQELCASSIRSISTRNF